MRISDWSSDVCSSDLMRMNAHGRPYIGVALSSGQHRIPFIFARRNVEHDADSRCAGALEYGSLILDQAFVVQMAVTIDKHQTTEERRGGKAVVSKCRYRRSQDD